MMYGSKRLDPAIVTMKPTNKAGSMTAAESVEPRAGGRGERGPAKHAPDADPGARVTGAGGRMSSEQRQGRRNGSPRCSTMLISTCSGCRSTR